MKQLALHLIKQDIKHNQLLNGLNQLGLYDNERYTLDLVGVVGELLDIRLTEKNLNFYHSKMLDVLPNMTMEMLNNIAFEILTTLEN